MAVYKHNGLLKASISSATNAHRLGANEAPPAIISSFLGKQLSQVLEHIEESTKDNLISLSGKQGMKLDIPQIPELMMTTPTVTVPARLPFTGNRFEFRAVGSEANCASAMIAPELRSCRATGRVQEGCRQTYRKRANRRFRPSSTSSVNISRYASLFISTVTATATRMESRSQETRSGLRNQCAPHLRQLPEARKHPDVRIRKCHDAERTRSPQRSEVGKPIQRKSKLKPAYSVIWQ